MECSSLTMLRPVSVRYYLAMMLDAGFCVDDMLAGTTINFVALDNPEYLISGEDYRVFLRNIIRLDGDRGLALRLAALSEVMHFGVLGYAGLSCGTIRQVLCDVWRRYGKVFGVPSRLNVVAEEDIDTVVIDIDAPKDDEICYRFYIEEALGILSKIGGDVAASAVPFTAIDLAYPKPLYGDCYQEIFHCAVQFDAARSQIKLSRQWLDSPIKTSETELNNACCKHLDDVLRQIELACPIALKVRELIASHANSLPSVAQVARMLGTSPRTLARQLSSEGYTYRQLTGEMRAEFAKNRLAVGNIPAKEVSYRLGFSDVAAFRRAFKQWTGKTISQYCSLR